MTFDRLVLGGSFAEGATAKELEKLGATVIAGVRAAANEAAQRISQRLGIGG
jgi:hypothetical protein